MHIKFRKYQGTGNDFIIVDNRGGALSGLSDSQVAFLCDRKMGIGADGLMMLEVCDGYDFRMVYFNADGHEGSMCGNGGRCLVQFAFDMGIRLAAYNFIAVDGPHEAKIDSNGLIHLKMKDVDDIQDYGKDKVLNTGSPHYIRFVEDLDATDVFTEGRNIRYNKTYAEAGINVNFVTRSEDGIRIRTYERGVENETLSCGTGATAAALASTSKTGIQEIPVTVEGGKLSIRFNRINDISADNIWLIGPATFVFEGMIAIN